MSAENQRKLHLKQPQIMNASSSPSIDQVLKDIKEEPLDKYQPPRPAKIIPLLPVKRRMPLFPVAIVPRPTRAVKERIPLKQKIQKVQKSGSPPSLPRVFLSAAEPMKDFDEDQFSYKRFTVERVYSFTPRNLRPFGKRPPNTDHKSIQGGIRLSSVLIQDPNDKKITEEIEELKREKKHKETEKNLRLEAEDLRQKRALAQKFALNEYRIWEHMQIDKFDKVMKPEELSPFEKFVMNQGVLSLLPDYSESLRRTDQNLLNNLKRIQGMNEKPIRKYNRKNSKLGRISGPVRLDHEHPSLSRRAKPKEKRTPKMIKVMWHGISTEVPDEVICHLCSDRMLICMRKGNYRGELREYPAYRCLRKGCQTFRSVKKQIDRTAKAFCTEAGSRNPNELHPTHRSIIMSQDPLQTYLPKEPKKEPGTSLEASRASLSMSVKEFLRARRRSKFDDLSRDFSCENSDEEEEDLGETVSFKYLERAPDDEPGYYDEDDNMEDYVEEINQFEEFSDFPADFVENHFEQEKTKIQEEKAVPESEKDIKQEIEQVEQ